MHSPEFGAQQPLHARKKKYKINVTGLKFQYQQVHPQYRARPHAFSWWEAAWVCSSWYLLLNLPAWFSHLCFWISNHSVTLPPSLTGDIVISKQPPCNTRAALCSLAHPPQSCLLGPTGSVSYHHWSFWGRGWRHRWGALLNLPLLNGASNSLCESEVTWGTWS